MLTVYFAVQASAAPAQQQTRAFGQCTGKRRLDGKWSVACKRSGRFYIVDFDLGEEVFIESAAVKVLATGIGTGTLQTRQYNRVYIELFNEAEKRLVFRHDFAVNVPPGTQVQAPPFLVGVRARHIRIEARGSDSPATPLAGAGIVEQTFLENPELEAVVVA